MTTLIQVECASCGERRTAKPEFLGKRGTCPKCQGIVFIPPPEVDHRPVMPSISRLKTLTQGDPPPVTRAIVLLTLTGAIAFALRGWIGIPVSTTKQVTVSENLDVVPTSTGTASNSGTKLELKSSGRSELPALDALFPLRSEFTPALAHQLGDMMPLDLPGGSYGVRSVLFFPDGASAFTLFAANGGSVLSKWSLETGRLLGTAGVMQQGDDCEWSFSPDGQYLAGTLSHCDQGAMLVDPASGVVINTQRTDKAVLSAPGWSPDGKSVFYASHVGGIDRWEIGSGELSHVASQGKAVTRIAVSSDGGYLLSGDVSGEIRIWDLEHGCRYVATYQGLRHPIQLLQTRIYDDGVLVLAVAGRRSESWQLNLFDLQTRQVRHRAALSGQVQRVAVSGDWRRFVVGHRGGKVSVWDLPTGKEIQTSTPHVGDVTAVAISSDGVFSLSGCLQSPEGRDTTVRLRGLPLPETSVESSVME